MSRFGNRRLAGLDRTMMSSWSSRQSARTPAIDPSQYAGSLQYSSTSAIASSGSGPIRDQVRGLLGLTIAVIGGLGLSVTYRNLRFMAKSKKPEGEPEPSPAEVAGLHDLMFDRMLFSAHGMIVGQVRDGVHALLVTLGRPRLAALWADVDALRSTHQTNCSRGTAQERRQQL